MSHIWKERFRFLPMLIKLLIAKILPKKEPNTWIICERGTDARDNGYHFTKWCTNEHPEQKIAYIITKDSTDRKRIEDLNCEIINYGSFRHYQALASARILISTHVFGYAPHKYYFAKLDKKFPNLIPGKKVCLQHGIFTSDIPSAHKEEAGTDLNFFGTEMTYEECKIFGYNNDEMICAGLCRYDKLRTAPKPKKQILVMPTWRQWLKYGETSKSIPDIENSEYIHKWKEFLTDPELETLLAKNNLTLIFYPHYEMQSDINLMAKPTKHIKLAKIEDNDVQELLIESALLITDYSSVQYDFAFMNKPIILYQFDRDRFYKEHYSKKFYNGHDIFGPITQTKQELINATRNTIETNFTTDPKYTTLKTKFFTGIPDNCCETTYKAIHDLDQKNRK